MNNIYPPNPSGRPSGSENFTTGVSNLRSGTGIRGDTGAGKDIQKGNVADNSKAKPVSLGTREQATSKYTLPENIKSSVTDNTRAGEAGKSKPSTYESYKYGAPENLRAGVSSNVRPDAAENIRMGGYSNLNNITKSSSNPDGSKVPSASTSKPTSYGAKIETSSNTRPGITDLYKQKYEAPVNKIGNVQRSASSNDPSQGLSTYTASTKPKESKTIFGNDQPTYKYSSQYEKGSIGGPQRTGSNIETSTKSNIPDYRSGLSSNPSNPKPDLLRREDEYKKNSRLTDLANQKYSSIGIGYIILILFR